MGRTRRRVVLLCIAASLSFLVVENASAAVPTDQDRADNAIGYLARQQADDGSMPGFSAIGSTADAELAVRAANIGADVEHGAMTFLRKEVRAGNATQIGLLAKVALAVAASGGNARDFGGKDLVADLVGRIRAGGHFQKASVLDQALGILALAAANAPRLRPKAAGWLANAQCPDGGWAFDVPYAPATDDQHCDDGSGSDFFLSDTNTTGYSVMALATLKVPVPLPHNPFGFFDAVRDAGHGGWGYTWGFQTTDANSTGLVLQAYAAEGSAPPAGSRSALRKLQYARCGAFAFTWNGDARTAPDPGATIGAAPGLLGVPFPIEGPPQLIGNGPATPRCRVA
jgi:hypothetical protein